MGQGGREHALAWRLLQSPAVARVLVAPGNGGTAQASGMENVRLDGLDFPGLIALARQRQVALTLVGPEVPLAAGIVDAFQAAGLPCFGPCRQAARLEASKTFAKGFMRRHNIPTADYETFTNYQPAADYIRRQKTPIILKADGLAAGKGVVIADSIEVALRACRQMLTPQARGQDAARAAQAPPPQAAQAPPVPPQEPPRILIESFLDGEELSFIVIADGKNCLPFSSGKDHKRAFDQDQGPNTGGMGAYSPVPWTDAALDERIMQRIIRPTLAGMAEEGTPYVGFLYAGLMINSAGDPYVVEFNCRFGDPEAQPVLLRLQDDLYALCQQALAGHLPKQPLAFDPRYALGVVMASGGYPNDYQKGLPVTDHSPGGSGQLTESEQDADLQIFHAGTQHTEQGLVTDGGRVLCVTALGQTLHDAADKAYARCQSISWPDAFYRKDIGRRL